MIVISLGKSFLSPSAKVDFPEPVPPAIPMSMGVISCLRSFFAKCVRCRLFSPLYHIWGHLARLILHFLRKNQSKFFAFFCKTECVFCQKKEKKQSKMKTFFKKLQKTRFFTYLLYVFFCKLLTTAKDCDIINYLFL